jgi:hypothetical protein
LARTDAVWRALGRAAVLEAAGFGPRLLLTSHLPAAGSEPDLALRAGAGLFSAVVEVLDPEASARLRALTQTGSDDPPMEIPPAG